jgi:hypothetical protein
MRGRQVTSHGQELREHQAFDFVNSVSLLAGTPHALDQLITYPVDLEKLSFASDHLP